MTTDLADGGAVLTEHWERPVKHHFQPFPELAVERPWIFADSNACWCVSRWVVWRRGWILLPELWREHQLLVVYSWADSMALRKNACVDGKGLSVVEIKSLLNSERWRKGRNKRGKSRCPSAQLHYETVRA